MLSGIHTSHSHHLVRHRHKRRCKRQTDVDAKGELVMTIDALLFRGNSALGGNMPKPAVVYQ